MLGDGRLFDISHLLADPDLFDQLTTALSNHVLSTGATKVASLLPVIPSRIFG